jgi:hypothetical protein
MAIIISDESGKKLLQISSLSAGEGPHGFWEKNGASIFGIVGVVVGAVLAGLSAQITARDSKLSEIRTQTYIDFTNSESVYMSLEVQKRKEATDSAHIRQALPAPSNIGPKAVASNLSDMPKEDLAAAIKSANRDIRKTIFRIAVFGENDTVKKVAAFVRSTQSWDACPAKLSIDLAMYKSIRKAITNDDKASDADLALLIYGCRYKAKDGAAASAAQTGVR